MSDSRFMEDHKQRIGCGDFDAIFAHGGCFVFAQRLCQRYDGYRVRGFSIDGETLVHVWAKREEKCVDIRGDYPEHVLAMLANAGRPAPQPRDVPMAEVEAAILTKSYSPEVLEEFRRLADQIIDTHERFHSVKPPDPLVIERFAADLAKMSANRVAGSD